MSMENRIPFLANVGGKSEQIARDFLAERLAALKARVAFIETRGVKNLWGNDSHVVGYIVPRDAVPAGFRRDLKYGTDHEGNVLAVPDGKQRATYKQARDELAAIPKLPGCWELDNRIGFGGYLRGMSMMLASVELVGDRYIFSIPRMEKNQFVPADCVELKLSEYYALKEKAAT